MGKAEPSEFVAACESVNEDDCELGEIVKYANENVRAELKIVYDYAINYVGATSLQMLTVIVKLVVIVEYEASWYLMLSVCVPTVDESLE